MEVFNMLLYILIPFLLGLLFAYLTVTGFRRFAAWATAARLNAKISAVQYTTPMISANIIEDASSSAKVTFEFDYQGQLCRKVKIYKGIIDSPRLNETVPVFYRPVSGNWIPRREVTYWWILFSIFALISFAVGGIFLVKGRQVLVGISDYHVDHPNVYGNLLYITAGFLMFTAGVLCIRFLLPLCLQPLFRPLIIAVKHLAGRYQETDAHFAGMIRKEVTTDSTDYFPLFVFPYQCPERSAQWYSTADVSKKKYQIGEPCLLYQDTKTGTFALKPDFSDMSRFIFSILPLMLAAAFILSLLGFGFGLAWMGSAGF